MNDILVHQPTMSAGGFLRPARCQSCPLRTPTVLFSGDPLSSLVIVGESPGEYEVAKGAPFIGDSGKLLKEAFPKDFDSRELMLTNAQQCYPTKQKDAAKLALCCHACHDRLIAELTAAPREVILAVGNGALWSLTGDYSLKITKERGKIFPSPLATKGIVAAYHPAFVLRGGGSYKIFREDVRYAFSLLTGEKKKPPIYEPSILRPLRTDLEHILWKLSQLKLVASDIETTGLNPRKDEITDVGLAFPDEKIAYIIPIKDLPYFRGIYDVPDVKWIWHNGKFDSAFLNQAGYPARVDEDTMLLSYALNEAGGIHGLEDLAKDHLGADDYKYKVDPYVKKGEGFENVPKEILYRWRLAPDCGYTLESWQRLRSMVRADDNLERLYSRVLIPASTMLQHVEHRGFYVDRVRLKENDDFYSKEVARYAEEINTHVRATGNDSINPNSWQQLSHILYGVIGLKNKYKSLGTSEDILKANTPDHPITHSILKYREVAKAYGTYVKGLWRHIDDGDGCVHSTYKLHGTRTGRLSSSEPNLQNIPRDPRLRGVFVARPGHVLLEFDLDQAELRCLAALSGDPEFCRIYESNQLSLHHEVSKKLWPNWAERYAIKDPSDPVYQGALEDYMRTKALNFGIVYGREEFSIADEFKVPTSEAREWIDWWFKGFPIAKQFIDACRRTPSQGKSLITVFGRKKRHGAVSLARLKSLQNEAANFPHQSCASDITLVTAIKTYLQLEMLGAYIVNLVHDSFVVECPDNPERIREVREIVEPSFVATPKEWGLTRIPFKVDCKMGTRWGLGQKMDSLLP